MDRTGVILVLIVLTTGSLASKYVAPELNKILRIGFVDELIIFVTVFVGASLLNRAHKRKKKDKS